MSRSFFVFFYLYLFFFCTFPHEVSLPVDRGIEDRHGDGGEAKRNLISVSRGGS